MTATAPITSAVFSKLLSFLQPGVTSDTITNYLTGAGVNADVADIIAQAITSGGTATLPSNKSIQLGQLITPLLPSGVSAPAVWSDSTLTLLSFEANAVNQILAMSGSLTVPLTMASFSTTTLSVNLEMAITGGSSASTFNAALSGSLPLANSQFTAKCDLTADGQTLKLAWTADSGEELQLTDLATDFQITSFPSLPDGLPDMHLTEASATVDLSQTADTFEMTAVSAYPGEAFVSIDQPDGGSWRLACGIALAPDVTAFSPIGDFSGLGVTLTAAELLVATDTFEKFEWPAAAGGQGSVFESFPFDLQQGVAIMAILDLSAAADKTLAGNLKALNASNSENTTATLLLSAQLQDTLSQTMITASLGNCKVFGYSLDLMSLSIGLPLVVAAKGTITFSNWNNMTASVMLAITDEMVQGTVDVSDSSPYALISLPGLKINELGGLVGIDFDKGEVTMGFVGQFTLGTLSTGGSSTDPAPDPKTLGSLMPANPGGASMTLPQPNAGELAVMVGIQVESGVPDVDLLILRLTEVDFTDLLGVVIDPPPDTSTMSILDNLKLTDVLLYWCDEAPGGLLLPDGTSPSPGFKVHGAVDFWKGQFDAWAELEIDTDGIKGAAYLSQITIGDVLTIKGAAPPAKTVPSDVTTGGPWLQFDTSASPFLSGSWDIKVLDIEETLGVTVSDQGFTFKVTNNAPNVFSDDFTCTLSQDWTKLQIEVQGSFVGDVTLPPLDGYAITLYLDTSFDVTITASENNGSPTFSVSGSFDVGSGQISIPNLTLNASISCFSDIPGAVLSLIKDPNNGSAIFSDAITEAESWILKYGDEVLKAFEKAAESVIHDTVYLLLHIHHDHSSSWMSGNGIVAGDATINGVAFYQLAGGLRRYIPDMETLGHLVSGDKFKVIWDPVDGQYTTAYDNTTWPDPDSATGSQLLVDSLPIDTLQVPSRIDGTLVYEQTTNDIYLMVSSLTRWPGKWRIQDPSVFKAVLNLNNPNWPTCSRDDINEIEDNNVLNTQCTINSGPDSTGTVWQYLFVDGVRYHIPDPTTWGLMRSQFQPSKAIVLPAGALAGIPAGPDLMRLAEGDFARCFTTIYLVYNNQLCQVQNMNSFYAWGGKDGGWTTITTTQLGVMNQGKDLPENPPS